MNLIIHRFISPLYAIRQPLRCAATGVALGSVLLVATVAIADQPAPVLNALFPAGGAAGGTVEVTVSGNHFLGAGTLYCSAPGVQCKPLDANRWQLAIPADTPPGQYDLWAVCENGVSGPRTFSISRRNEQLEAEPNESRQSAQAVPLNVVVNGRIEKEGDQDHFRFEAKRGQRVVIECWAERIDSRLRAILEVFDVGGQRLAVNRGYYGIDPLIDFRVPSDGTYIVKVQDLIYSGGTEHYYRLEIDTGPRVAFAVPCVVERGKATRVTLHGWNLRNAVETASIENSSGVTPVPAGARGENGPMEFDRIEVEIPATKAQATWPLPMRLQPSQALVDGFSYHHPGSHAAVVIGVTDAPVVVDRSENHSPASAQALAHPCEVSGQLAAGDERDWFAIDARRGEVLFIEALAQRINSPVDLKISVFGDAGREELLSLNDETRNIGGKPFPTSHLDPAGRFVVPADGRYLIVVRNLIGGVQADLRRLYRLSVRREEPDFRLVAAPRNDDPAALNLPRGGRTALDVVALRNRGMTGPIRISAKDLPEGLDCPEVWLGPGVDRGTVVVSAERSVAAGIFDLKLEGFAEGAGFRPVRGGTVVRSGSPTGWGRITSQLPVGVAGEAALRITADGNEPMDHHLYGRLKPRHAPGGILDVAVRVERRDGEHQAPVRLIGMGLPDQIRNQTAIIPAGETKGYLSFYLPPTLEVGRYSFVVRAETTVPTADKKTESVTVHSNPVTFEVQPAAFLVEIDPYAPTRVRRGETFQVSYTVQRRNRFIGKTHTELASPGRITNVVGLRGRGETFVGQSDKGSLQIIVNPDAPLGQQAFLRLFSVGVVEDEPIYQGSSFFNLEILE